MPPKTPNIAGDFRRFNELLRPERRSYALGLVALLFVNACDVIAPLFLAIAVDVAAAQVGGPAPTTPPLLAFFGMDAATLTFAATVIIFLMLQVGANVSRYPMLMYVAVPSHRIGQTVRNTLVDHFLRLSMPFYDRAKSGDLMSRATNDVHQVRMMYGPGVLVGADTIFIITLVVTVMLSLSWKLTLIAMIPLPIIALVTNVLSHAEYNRFEAVQDDLSELTERARESFAGIRVLQAYAREGFDLGRFRHFSHRHLAKQLDLARVRSVLMPTLDLMMGISIVLILLFGGTAVVRDTMSIGTFVAFLFLVGYMSGPMMGFGWSVSLFQRGRASMRRIDALLAEPIDIVDAPNARVARAVATDADHTNVGGIEVHNLTFRYPERVLHLDDADADTTDDKKSAKNTPDEQDEDAPIVPTRELALQNITLSVAPGETLGIIGPVGSGKSTLAKLLVRLYDPPAGAVSLDGDDVLELTLASLRETIVVAPQDTFLFSDTVERNVTMAASDLDPVQTFTRNAHLHDEILELKHGYETMLGERGVNLSGGQRQRLAIARSIAANPKVLVLDDCLSAVDAKTEEAILASLREVFENRTGIIISHRVCAVQGCDKIAVLEEGRLVAHGTHAQLREGDGYYARIAREQGVGTPDAAQSGEAGA